MNQKIKISQHQFSFKHLPHEHTSYGLLSLVLLIVGTLMVIFSFKVDASPGPQAGSIGLNGAVPEKPPSTSATITSPSPNQHFTTVPITVSGKCPQNTLVEIYKNDIFAGSTTCDSSGNFSLKIDLLFGQNSLIAKVYDNLDQAGPDSNPVTVYYDASLPNGLGTSFINLTGQQLVLNTDAAYRGSFPGEKLNVPITVIGGTPPFAVNVQWGDQKNQIIPAASNTTINATHSYSKPGTYTISLQGGDSKQLVAFLNVEAIINGQPNTLASNFSSTKSSPNLLSKVWPLFAVAVTLVFSFWMGERREKKLLRTVNKVQILPPTPPSPLPQQ